MRVEGGKDGALSQVLVLADVGDVSPYTFFFVIMLHADFIKKIISFSTGKSQLIFKSVSLWANHSVSFQLSWMTSLMNTKIDFIPGQSSKI